ncbi:MAG: hypothetical protein Ct9H300mP8_08930 [Gammaproteobacteria bacterium]|nr:MAG: hypothetical protein Ct9H300mP8_08930 [Gammaproteobacteria bacterium]
MAFGCSCDEAPPSITTLQLHEIPPSGGDTLFSSMYAAYDALSDRMKTLLDGLTAHHSGEDAYRRLFRFDNPGEASWPEANHPLVREHPESPVRLYTPTENLLNESMIFPAWKQKRSLDSC